MPNRGQTVRTVKNTVNTTQSSKLLSLKSSPGSVTTDNGGVKEEQIPNRSRSPFSDFLFEGRKMAMQPTVRNAPPPSLTDNALIFNDNFLTHLTSNDFSKPPTDFGFANPQANLFSSAPVAYEYINPRIRSVNGVVPSAPESATATFAPSQALMESRKNPAPLASRNGRSGSLQDQENVAPVPRLADMSQYINPDIHSSHPAFRNGNSAGFALKNGRKEPRPDTFKTVMCQAWLESTYCAFGEECKFAHGESELRPAALPIRNSQKYKTKLCDKYTTSGICPYGRRCLFIHPDPASSEAYRRHAVAQTLVHNTIGLPVTTAPLTTTTPVPPTPVSTTSSTTSSVPLPPTTPPPFATEDPFTTPFANRPHPSWPLESPGFFNRRDCGGFDRMAFQKYRNNETISEHETPTGRPTTDATMMPPLNANMSRDAIRFAARAAAAAAKQSGAPLGMSEEILAEHLAQQLMELQRTQSSSSAYGHLMDEQTTQTQHTHSLPNSRHSSISPFSNASTGSTSGVWSCTQSPEDCFTDNVFYTHDDNDHQTPKFASAAAIRRITAPPSTRQASDNSEVSVEIQTPSADMFQNLTRTLNL